MYAPLLNILAQYGLPVLAGIVVGLVCKAYFASQVHNKIRGYQGEIVKSHEKILELEALTDKLQRKVKEVENTFSKEKLFLN